MKKLLTFLVVSVLSMQMLFLSFNFVSASNYNGEQLYVLGMNIDESQASMKTIKNIWITYSDKTVAKYGINTTKTNATFDALSRAVWIAYSKNTKDSSKKMLAYLYQLVNDRSQQNTSNSAVIDTNDTIKETTNTTTPSKTPIVQNSFPFVCEKREWFEEAQATQYDEMGDAGSAYYEGGESDIVELSERFEISNGTLQVPFNDFTGEGGEAVKTSHPHYAVMTSIATKKDYQYLTVQKVNNSVMIFADGSYGINDLYINGVLYEDFSIYGISSEQLASTKQALGSIYEIQGTDLMIATKYEIKRDPDMLTKVLGYDMGELKCEIK